MLPRVPLLLAGLLLPAAAGAVLPAPLRDGPLTYRRITMASRLRAFYREGGRAYLGQRVHLLVPGAVFEGKPIRVTRPDGRSWYDFPNRTVPILVSPRNLYYRRLRRLLSAARRRHRPIRTVSLFGRVIRPSWDLKGRCHILFEKAKTYGGALKQSVD